MVEVESGCVAVFRLYRPGAWRVDVAGSFNGWERGALAMRRHGDGWWSLRARLAPGEHLFNYRIDGHAWLPDFAASGIQRNGFGGWVSCLVVAHQIDAAPRTGPGQPRRPVRRSRALQTARQHALARFAGEVERDGRLATTPARIVTKGPTQWRMQQS